MSGTNFVVVKICGGKKMDIVEQKLKSIEELIADGLDAERTARALEILGFAAQKDAAQMVRGFVLWGDTMPMGDEHPYTEEQRDLHILWECLDRCPLGINCAFAVPLRQAIAAKLFKRCGKGFVANEGCRFNYGHQIEVGDNVSWNAGCYIDSKGGVKFGDFAMLTEYVKVFTHSHSEEDHMERSYAPVVIGDYAKVYTAATILPGVTLGTGAVVATGAIVTKDVPPFALVGGIPAKPMRERKSKDVTKFNQFMMKDGMFQK